MNAIRCLHCDQTRAQIKTNNTICGTETGYEYIELDEEWPRHRWGNWTDKNLAGFGILPDAFDRYRRIQITQVQWIGCADTTTGHAYAREDNEWGDLKDRCFGCGRHKETQDTE